MEDCLVLIVDDNPHNIQIIGRVLKDTYKTAFCAGGAEALLFLEKSRPDLILLDVMMPEMDGFTLCRTLKADDALKDIPVIFLTARTDTESIVKGFECGAADYIVKPFQRMELLARARAHLSLKRAADTQARLIGELKQALEEIKTLRGLLPICSFCKRIRRDTDYWEEVEVYIEKATDAQFSHSICPECAHRHYPDIFESPDLPSNS